MRLSKKDHKAADAANPCVECDHEAEEHADYVGQCFHWANTHAPQCGCSVYHPSKRAAQAAQIQAHWSEKYTEEALLLCERARAFGNGTGMDVERPCICDDPTALIRAAEQRRDALWQEAVRAVEIEHFGVLFCHPEQGAKGEPPCVVCPPLRALLASGASAPAGGPHGK